jgi:hypothetical protein
MPTEPRQVPVSPQPDAAQRRLHIHGIKEMPAGYDAEVAELFRDLRAATTLTEMDLAGRLGTRPEVVQALEQGALYALPPWAETCRVVNAYGAFLNLDVRPLLRRIYAQLEAGIVELQPKSMPDHPVMTPPENGDFGYAATNSGGAARPNPLDIPWPPPQQMTPPPQQQRPHAAPQPHAPRPNAAPQYQPQAPRPNAAPQPQPQNAWPQAQPAQHHPQAWPGTQPPQAPRPNPPQARPPQPQPPPQAPRPTPPQARPVQAQAPQFQPQPQPQPQPIPPRQAPMSEPDWLATEFGAAGRPPLDEPKAKRAKPALLKWGLVILMISVVAFGLWFALSKATGPAGLQLPGAGKLDPDDPRSRKSDRLPSPF